MRRRAILALVATLSAPACTRWEVTRTEDVAIGLRYLELEVASPAGFSVDASISTSGALLVRMTARGTCTVPAVRTWETRATMHRKPTWLPVLGFIVGPISALGAPAFAIAPPPECDCDDQRKAAAIIGVVGAAALVGAILSVRDMPSRTKVIDRDDRPVEGSPSLCPLGLVPLPGRLTAVPPWGTPIDASVNDTGHAIFRGDLTATGIDPFGDPTLGAGPWQLVIDGEPAVLWRPTATDLDRLRAAVGEATGLEPDVGDDALPPDLIVEALSPTTVRSGAATTVAVTLRNTGRGGAYRVFAVLKSTVPELHGRRIAFGRIAAGERETRRLTVTLAEVGQVSTPLVVVEVEEAHGHVAPAFDTRIRVELPDRPALTLACAAMGTSTDADGRPRVEPGQQVTVTCTLANTGTSTATGVSIAATLGGAVSTTKLRDVPAGQRLRVSLEPTVPSDAVLGERLVVAIVARETSANVDASTSVELWTGAGSICDGIDDPNDVERRLRVLRGTISDDELARREADLVRCLD